MLEKIEDRRRREHKDEMAGGHHRCNSRKLGQITGDVKEQRGLACCSPWGHKQSHTTA